jgi:hypothetical protein
VLLAVQAAVLRGARQIRATITTQDVTLTFDGGRFSAEELDRIYDAALVPAPACAVEARSLRKLGLALGAVRGLDWRLLTLDSGDDSQAVRLASRPAAEDVIGPSPEPVPGTRLRVKRSDPIGESFGLSEEPGEAEALRTRCRHLGIPLSVNGLPVTGLERFPFAPRTHRLDLPEARGAAFLAPCFDHPPALEIVQHGVLIERRPFPAKVEHFMAVVDAPTLRTDLTDLALVQDAERETCYERALALHPVVRAEVDLERHLPDWLDAEVAPHLDAIERVRDLRSRRCFPVNWLLWLALLQVATVPLILATVDPPRTRPWDAIGIFEGLSVIVSGLVALFRPIVLRPHPGDPVALMIEDRLGASQAMHAAAARIVRSSRPELRDYFPR